MTKEQKIAKALRAYGEDIRSDWSDLDGRSVMRTLDELADALESDETFDLEVWLYNNIREYE